MIFDVEANGLLEEATKLHVMSFTEGSEVKFTYDYSEMKDRLLNAKVLIGHNIIRYDLPLLEKLLKIKIKARRIDTLALSWYLNHSRRIHGLDSYGEDYGIPKPKINDWHNLSQEEYANRCVEDVKINRSLWKDLRDKLLRIYGSKEEADRLINYLSFKMDCAREQERSGWKLDLARAEKNRDILEVAQEEKVEQLKLIMPSVQKFTEKTKPPKPFKKDGTISVAGANWAYLLKQNNLPEDFNGSVKVLAKEEEPNPNSHAQIKDWLFSLGWEPEAFDYKKEEDGTERKIPQVRVEGDSGKELCPSVIRLAEKEPDVKVLEGLSVIQHRLSTFKGFLENHRDGWIKAEIAGLTNTLRFKHKVLVNLPGVDKEYGEEIRGCLIAPEGYVLCGSDMVSLEATTKKHYIFPYDPDYVAEMSKKGFDEHLDLAKHAEKVTQEDIEIYVENKKKEKLSDNIKKVVEIVAGVRKMFKPVNYSAVYGVGAPKLSRTTGLPISQAKELLEAYWARNWAVKEIAANCKVKKLGGEMWLFNPVSRLYYSLRYDKDRFSTLNQGTGVFCFDSWIKEFRKKRSQLTGQFHDEIITCIKEGQEQRYEKLLHESIAVVNEKLKLNVTLGVDVQFGKTYAEIH